MILAGILQLASPLAASQGPWFLYSLRLVFGASVRIQCRTFETQPRPTISIIFRVACFVSVMP